jgi:hypothetical protein
MQLIGECLVSHCELTPTDIIWALEYNFSTLSAEQLATVVVHLCKSTDIGKFSLCYNFTVDSALIHRKSDQWAFLLNIDHPDAFPEFYKQLDQFSAEQRKILQSTHLLEYNAAYQLITSIDKVEFPLRQYLIRKCPTVKAIEIDSTDIDTPELSKAVEVMSSPFSEGGVTVDGKKNVTMFKQCYDKVCMMENIDIHLRAEPSDDIIQVPDVDYISAGDGVYRFAVVYCMKILTLIEALTLRQVEISQNNTRYITAINPGTNRPFDLTIYNMLRRRMDTEIKLYTYFAQKCAISLSSEV